MIVVEEPTELLLVTQPDHARFAAQLLSLWRRAELREHPRRELLLEAVREHDNGWLEADAAPRIDRSTGRPYDFRTLPDEHRRELWRRGVERFADDRPYSALLAAQHSWEIHRDRRDDPAWAAFLKVLAERRGELLAVAGLDAAQLAADYRWLELADTLSLAVCCRSPAPVARDGLTARLRDGELEIDPFPLAGTTTFQIPCRRIANSRYGGEAELARALGTARWTRLEVRCRPSSDARP
ncbi:MAG: DUF3891 family protein [Thermoanaerobaculia bacterium]